MEKEEENKEMEEEEEETTTETIEEETMTSVIPPKKTLKLMLSKLLSQTLSQYLKRTSNPMKVARNFKRIKQKKRKKMVVNRKNLMISISLIP